jgi:uncharacterized protein DUF4177
VEAYMQRWEYKVVDDVPSEDELNKLGADGWELIAITATGSAYCRIRAYLKRSISN